jgi:tRNA A37 threonylcarbamoyladenosine synthetase subunit TsaC/SUA5/YrdC
VSSANRSGDPTPSTCDAVEATFGGAVEVYLCAPEPLVGTASTVVDLAHGEPVTVRVGAVSERNVADALRDVVTSRGSEDPV